MVCYKNIIIFIVGEQCTHEKILILGANGFIGKNLKEYLSCFSKDYVLFVPNSQELNLLDEQAVKIFSEYLF